MPDRRVFVCTNQKSGVGDDLAKALKKELKAQDLKSVVLNGEKVRTQVQTCNCLDRCKQCKKGPGAAVVLYPDDVYYNNVQPKDAPRLVQELAARLGL
jgi:(2Fe-2S) ferredoxin